MPMTTILINDVPKVVVRPTDTKALNRFLRNGRSYLLSEQPDGSVTHRGASEEEIARWKDAFALHKAWGGDEEAFFGIPL